MDIDATIEALDDLHLRRCFRRRYPGCTPPDDRRETPIARMTGDACMEVIGDGFLNLMRASERLSGRRPLLEDIGGGMRLTIYAARQEHRP